MVTTVSKLFLLGSGLVVSALVRNPQPPATPRTESVSIDTASSGWRNFQKSKPKEINSERVELFERVEQYYKTSNIAWNVFLFRKKFHALEKLK